MVRLERLREYVEQLKVMKNHSTQEFTKNALVHGATERYLHLAIESLLDIGNHFLPLPNEDIASLKHTRKYSIFWPRKE